MSHELRTPLTSIRGYAEALEEEAIAPAEAARVIETEAGRLERLVADLLELARFGRADFSVGTSRSTWPTWCATPWSAIFPRRGNCRSI